MAVLLSLAARDQVGHQAGRVALDAAQPLADDDERLAAVAHATEVHRRRLHRRHRDLGSQPFDVALREVRILDGAARRHVDARTSDELAHLLAELVPIARELDRVDRRERIHEADDVGRTERRPHKLHEVGTGAVGARHLADVVLVPEDEEQPDVVLRRLGRRMRARPDRQRHIVVFVGLAVVLDELKGADFLGDAVLLELEVGSGQRRDRHALAVEHGHVDADELGASPEHRLGRLRLAVRWTLSRSRRLGRRHLGGYLRHRGRAQHEPAPEHGGRYRETMPRSHHVCAFGEFTPARRKPLTTELVGVIVAEVEMRRFSFSTRIRA